MKSENVPDSRRDGDWTSTSCSPFVSIGRGRQANSGSERQGSSRKEATESDLFVSDSPERSQQLQPQSGQRTDCKTDGEQSQESSQNDCFLYLDSPPTPNSLPDPDAKSDPASIRTQYEENQKSCCPCRGRQSDAGSCQGIVFQISQHEYQIPCVQTAEYQAWLDRTLYPTHIGLIDASGHPLPDNAKTKIVEENGWLRRVVVDSHKPENTSRDDHRVCRRECRNGDGVGLASISLENVKEHAPPLAGAHVETGVEVHDTGDVADRAASGGCCVSSC